MRIKLVKRIKLKPPLQVRPTDRRLINIKIHSGLRLKQNEKKPVVEAQWGLAVKVKCQEKWPWAKLKEEKQKKGADKAGQGYHRIDLKHEIRQRSRSLRAQETDRQWASSACFWEEQALRHKALKAGQFQPV